MEHIVVKPQTKDRLMEIKKSMKTTSVDKVIKELLETHNLLSNDPRTKIVNEIDEIINKYDRLLTAQEKTFMLILPAFLRTTTNERKRLLKDFLNELHEDLRSTQTSLK